MDTYLERLNPEQREAVETVEGPLLVLAGAGTGKTRVLTTRFAHILLTRRAFPSQVLAVTFTNKAAREMRERVADLLGRPVEGLWLGTFHALCARMLRRHPEYVGLTSSFTILDTDDQLRLLKQVMAVERVDAKRWPAPQMLGAIQRWKDRGLTPERVTDAEDTDFGGGAARRVYREYQSRLAALNACDFGDLPLHVTEILRTKPDVLAQYHRAFRFILVDEYQDTNLVQYLWLRLLAQRTDGSAANICCVGDDDQSIYSWRGAEVENILRFEKDFSPARVVRLESNYRSTAPILAAASALIAHNGGRLGKTLRSGRNDSEGERVRVASVWDSEEEARLVGERMEELQREGAGLGGMAVLVRAGFQTRAFEERLIQLGLPYRVVGGLRFYERAEIRDAIAYMRVLQSPSDDLAFERIVNLPRRGVGDAALGTIHAASRADGIAMTVAVERLLASGAMRGRMREQLAMLMSLFGRLRAEIGRTSHVDLVAGLLEDSGYLQMWREDKSAEAPGRLENLKELVRALADFESLGGFLEHVSLVMENDEAAAERISLMTLHAAKGLEFDNVFLPGWEEGLFPSQRSMDEGGNAALEEERRLAYVGITRGKKRVMISHAANRRVYANWQSCIPSRFVDELPESEIELVGSAALDRLQRMTAAPVFGGQFPLVAARPRTVEAWEVEARPARAEPIAVGARVFHEKFGYGRVTASEDGRLEIEFEKAGPKRVKDSFVELVPE